MVTATQRTLRIAKTRGVKVARIDCRQRDLHFCHENNVRYYPTIRYYKNGEFLNEYSGGRDADDLISFAVRNCGQEDGKLVVAVDAEISVE